MVSLLMIVLEFLLDGAVGVQQGVSCSFIVLTHWSTSA